MSQKKNYFNYKGRLEKENLNVEILFERFDKENTELVGN